MTTATAHFCGNGLSRLPSTEKFERGFIMKVKDLLKMEIDIDVYDNVCEELGIAFCGPMEITEDGAAQFEVALNLDCIIKNDGRYCVCIVNVEDEFFPELWKFNLRKAKELFYSLAGYCDADDYDKWFKEVE